jgi:hypothetical protein
MICLILGNVGASSPLLAHIAATTLSVAYVFLIVGALLIALSSIFIVLPLLTNESAFVHFQEKMEK